MHPGFHRAFGASHNFCDLRQGQVLKKMQDQNLAMLDADLTQCLVNCRGIFFRKRWFFGFLKIIELNFLSLLP